MKKEKITKIKANSGKIITLKTKCFTDKERKAKSKKRLKILAAFHRLTIDCIKERF